jgi:hypothetical protein
MSSFRYDILIQTLLEEKKKLVYEIERNYYIGNSMYVYELEVLNNTLKSLNEKKIFFQTFDSMIIQNQKEVFKLQDSREKYF